MNQTVPISPQNIWKAWNYEPVIVILFLMSVFIYLSGTVNIWRRAGTGHGINHRQYLSFFGALLALLIAIVTPLSTLSDVLFSAHMVQHMILILVAAPLLVLSDFQLAFLWALPRGWPQVPGRFLAQSKAVSQVWKLIRHPAFAWILFTFTLWVWHAPRLYETALQNEAVHILEHVVYIVTATLFWWVLLKPTRQKRFHYGIAVLYLFTTVLQSGILGALMTFTLSPWYPYYAPLVQQWGLTPMQDQQLAGLIMWIPVGGVFALFTIGYFAAWLHAFEERSIQPHPSEVLNVPQKIKP